MGSGNATDSMNLQEAGYIFLTSGVNLTWIMREPHTGSRNLPRGTQLSSIQGKSNVESLEALQKGSHLV